MEPVWFGAIGFENGRVRVYAAEAYPEGMVRYWVIQNGKPVYASFSELSRQRWCRMETAGISLPTMKGLEE